MGRLTARITTGEKEIVVFTKGDYEDTTAGEMRLSDIKLALQKLAHYEDMEEQGRLIELPCAVGDELYRVTYPYRQPPKVTKYRVKNFRTIKKGQKLQLEVQADCVPAKNWMYFEDFCTTREEAEAKLAKLKGE